MSFEELLWNKYDILHDRYKQQYEGLSNLINMLTRMQNAAKEYSKSLKWIYNKNLPVCADSNTTQGKALDNLRLDFSIQADEFDEMSDIMQNKVIEPCRILVDQTCLKEKEKFNELKKIISSYESSLSMMEKSRNKFESSANVAEKLTISAKKVKYSITNEIEKEKIGHTARLSLLEAQEKEKIYKTNIENANKLRVESIEKQKEMLSIYRSIETEVGINIKNLLCFYIASLKKMVSSILVDLESLSEKFKAINLEDDLNQFLETNKGTDVPDPEIQFISYTPETNPDAIYDNPEIPFEVIGEIKTYLSDILPDFNIRIEEKKSQIRKLSSKVFTSNKEFVLSKDEKDELIDFIRDKVSRRIFLYTLNKQRTIGQFERSERLLSDLTEIVNKILELAEPEKDYESAKYCLALCQTFYVDDKNKKRRKYLFDNIKTNEWLISKDFWEGVIECMVQEEIKKNEIFSKELIAQEDEEQKRVRISNIAFSQVLPYSNHMLDFKIDKKIILETVNQFVKKYNILKEFEEAIIINVKERNYDEEEVIETKEQIKVDKKENETKEDIKKTTPNKEENESKIIKEIKNINKNTNVKKDSNMNKTKKDYSEKPIKVMIKPDEKPSVTKEEKK